MNRALAFAPALLLAVLCGSGCVAVPFASPPMQVAIGTGARSTLRPEEPASYDIPLEFRAAVHPLGFSERLLDRRADFGFGYMLEAGSEGRAQGLYLEGSGVLLAGQVGNSLGRLSTRLQGRFLFEDQHGGFGQGAALQLTGEITQFTDGPFESTDSDGGMFGHAFGEGSVGFYLEGAWFQLAGRSGWTATTGLLFRVPAAAGFAWTWIWELAD